MSEKEFFGFTADISSRANISGESDISAGQRSNESSIEYAESNSSSVESRNEEVWRYKLEFVIDEDFNKPTGLTTVLTATATAGDFFNLVLPGLDTTHHCRNKSQYTAEAVTIRTVNKDWITISNGHIKAFSLSGLFKE